MSDKAPLEIAPTITVGRYAGKRIDTLPNSYLRWMLTQGDFPKLWLDWAKKKLEGSNYSDLYLSLSRHAIDMFSKRFNHLWLKHVREEGDKADGIATFMARLAEEAWEKGEDVSKHRHQDDGVIKELRGIKWVFNVNRDVPEYRDVITVISSTD